jgi:hypothetical protein
LEIGAILALAGDLEGAQACVPDGLPKGAPEHPPQSLHIEAAPQLKAWPVYWNPILHLWAEMALAGGRPKAAFELVSAAPPMASDQVWPDLLVRSAIAAGEGDIARVQLARLAANPASYWLVADTSPPGFLRDAVGRAGQAGLASTEMASLEKLLQQLN